MMSKRNKRKKHWLLALSAAVALTAAVPSVVQADKANSGRAVIDSGSNVGKTEGAAVKTTITKEKAEALVRGYVKIPDEYKLQSVNLYTRSDWNQQRNMWNLSFIYKLNGKQRGSIEASIDADSGVLLGYKSYIDNPNAKPAYPLKVNRDKAREIALTFVSSMASAYKDQLQFNADYGAELKPPLNGQVRHTLRFNRLVGDIPFMDNYIDVEVDSEGIILFYDVSWAEGVNFKGLKPALSTEGAEAKLLEASNPELVYYTPYGARNAKDPLLVYMMSPIAIDAITGEVVRDSYRDSRMPSATPLTEKPLGSRSKGGKSLSREQAVQVVKDAFTIPADAIQEEANYQEYVDEFTGETRAAWMLNWRSTKNGREEGAISAYVDSSTGEIRSYYSYTDMQNRDAATAKQLPYEEIKSKAVKFVEQQLPWLTHQLYIVQPGATEIEQISKEAERGQYNFSFQRKVDGARVENTQVHIAIDAVTGEIRNYNSELSSFEYPEKTPPIISRDEAAAAWMKVYKMELTYIVEASYIYNGAPIPVEKYNVMMAAGEIQPGESKQEMTTKLVYRLVPRLLDESVYLDAGTGEWRNSETGDKTQLEKPKAADIEGHWAQRELELMAAYKALDIVDGKVRPNQVVTRGELIKMLVLAMNSGRQPIMYSAQTKESAAFDDVGTGSNYYPYIQNALDQNLIDRGDGTFNPEGKVNREEMAELIVRALGYNTLAEHDSLFAITFKDAGNMEQKGQAAIAVGLGIMSLTNGSFVPDREVTRAEAATAFFRFLSVRAELQGESLRN
ncbi:hypothetical protein PAECIP111893_00485 [Paenibacillus plantiphilus]|uniref:SLH domain-containing protein n=1 Tax=Paenibacillus plantiphilus TaxID=2905650 RepID=A0ABM9BUR5_9BACL|nr:S-layer homology domain-containing protein [Paenibacillus plantiphilus]CAH1193528.1 hypothetical protein PAECIP111893_00485 [Paenibacillus plantiphilus]